MQLCVQMKRQTSEAVTNDPGCLYMYICLICNVLEQIILQH